MYKLKCEEKLKRGKRIRRKLHKNGVKWHRFGFINANIVIVGGGGFRPLPPPVAAMYARWGKKWISKVGGGSLGLTKCTIYTPVGIIYKYNSLSSE